MFPTFMETCPSISCTEWLLLQVDRERVSITMVITKKNINVRVYWQVYSVLLPLEITIKTLEVGEQQTHYSISRCRLIEVWDYNISIIDDIFTVILTRKETSVRYSIDFLGYQKLNTVQRANHPPKTNKQKNPTNQTNKKKGVPIMVQQKQIRLGTTRFWVQSLASLRGLRIPELCRELWCSSQMQLGSGCCFGCGVGQQLQL